MKISPSPLRQEISFVRLIEPVQNYRKIRERTRYMYDTVPRCIELITMKRNNLLAYSTPYAILIHHLYGVHPGRVILRFLEHPSLKRIILPKVIDHKSVFEEWRDDVVEYLLLIVPDEVHELLDHVFILIATSSELSDLLFVTFWVSERCLFRYTARPAVECPFALYPLLKVVRIIARVLRV
ncbi:hypothetical protein BD410DRAFT_616884 [Rickenella mellea]|uniref:Uncharacterized protein n=1 Tax=Rickenella mellea TaxID=50990 RepID=A0A4Y7PMI8_9AGAM|nr:hypothetical protein BD410DRAFT_616884 [Rickenella mellea]